LPKIKVGLALSSGAAAGFTHVGVLTVLEKEGIPIDMIAGTSTGALVGALYAREKDANEVKRLIIEIGKKRTSYMAQLVIAKTRLIRATKAKKWLRTLVGNVEFKDLKIPFACIATDISTGEEVIINQGSVADGVRASGSFPVVVPAFKLNGRYLVDGGLVNPVPVSVLRQMGADFVIAVNATTDRRKKHDSAGKKPSIFRVIKQMIHISRYQTVKASLTGADVVIKPRVAHIRFVHFNRAEETILQGEEAAQETIIEIKRRLNI